MGPAGNGCLALAPLAELCPKLKGKMMAVLHTEPAKVTDVKLSEAPRSGQTLTGYGPKIPIGYMVRYGNRWHRVYMANYGNAGSAYIVSGGQDLYLDIDTSYRLEALKG